MKVTATIGVEPEPRKIAITPDGSKAYVALPGVAAGMKTYQFGNMIAVIDTKNDVVLGRIEVHGDPESVAMDPDGTRAYVSDGNANGCQPAEVHVIDIVKDVYLRPIILRRAAHFTPTAIDTTPDGKRLFVVSEATKNLLVIDTAAGTVLDRLNLQSQGVLVSKDGTKVYVFSPQKLFVIKSDSFEVVKSIDLSQVFPAPPPRFDSEAFRIVVNRAEDTAYLLGISKEVIVVNLTSGEVVAKIPFAEQPIRVARGLALTPDESQFLVSDYQSRTVAFIDTSTKTVVARVPVANVPSEIKISKDGKRAHVLQQHSTTMMTIIDIKTQSVLKSVDFPDMIAAALDFELSQDERYAYIACFDPNFIMVYDLQENKLAKVIDTGLDPFNTAMTSDKKYIYVTEFSSDSISVVDTTTNSITKTIKLDETSK
jgi:YVTN family beta-propeller protein